MSEKMYKVRPRRYHERGMGSGTPIIDVCDALIWRH